MRTHASPLAAPLLAIALLGAGCARTPAPVQEPLTLSGTTWTWMTAVSDGANVMPSRANAFTVTFGSDGQSSGTTDCNSYFGAYTADDQGGLTFPGPFGMTKKFCEGSQEADFIAMLGDVRTYAIDSSERVLKLSGESLSMLFSADEVAAPAEEQSVSVTPVTHAAFALRLGGVTVFNDPTDAAGFASFTKPNVILVSDIHGDHFSAAALTSLVGESTVIVAPKVVVDALPDALKEHAVTLGNGETRAVAGIDVTAVPMYNLPEAADARHVKGRGNGYVLEKDGTRVYVAGDTAATPEMKALKDIDLAFVPMNPPFTMTVEEAAEGVLAFAPKKVYPYHYRSQTGLSDVNEFKRLVDAGGKDITVVLENWYPAQ